MIHDIETIIAYLGAGFNGRRLKNHRYNSSAEDALASAKEYLYM